MILQFKIWHKGAISPSTAALLGGKKQPDYQRYFCSLGIIDAIMLEEYYLLFLYQQFRLFKRGEIWIIFYYCLLLWLAILIVHSLLLFLFQWSILFGFFPIGDFYKFLQIGRSSFSEKPPLVESSGV